MAKHTSLCYGFQAAWHIQKFFEGGFEIFLYGRENLGGFWDFFLKNPNKLKKNSQKVRVDNQPPSPEYTSVA